MHRELLFMTPAGFLAFVAIWTTISLVAVGLGMWVRGPARPVEPSSEVKPEPDGDPDATMEIPSRVRRLRTGTIHAPQYDRAADGDDRTVVIEQVPR